MNKLQSLLDLRLPGPDDVSGQVTDPADVLTDTRLSDDEKRALLASWATDANAVPHLPTLRQLPNGSIVKVADILKPLKALDSRAGRDPDNRRFVRRRDRDRVGRGWFKRTNRNDDDDDPPPCPAYAAVRPKSGGGAAFNFPEPVLA